MEESQAHDPEPVVLRKVQVHDPEDALGVLRDVRYIVLFRYEVGHTVDNHLEGRVLQVLVVGAVACE